MVDVKVLDGGSAKAENPAVDVAVDEDRGVREGLGAVKGLERGCDAVKGLLRGVGLSVELRNTLLGCLSGCVSDDESTVDAD